MENNIDGFKVFMQKATAFQTVGTMPEDLSTPSKSIKQIERERVRKEIK